MTDSSRPALAFFAPRYRLARAEALLAGCRTHLEGWLVSCHPLSRAAINEAFVRGCAIVGWCPPAILVRAVPWSDKRRDSPVLCFPSVACGQSVLLALSGWHHGGRALARALEAAWRQVEGGEGKEGGGGKLLVVGGSATEEVLGFSLEDLPQGWRLLDDTDGSDTDEALKALLPSSSSDTASRAARIACEIVGEDCGGFPPKSFFDLASFDLASFDLASGGDGRAQEVSQGTRGERKKPRIAVGFRRRQGLGADLRLVPRCVAVGVGCVRGASCAEIAELVDSCLAEADIDAASLAGLASVSLKCRERGLLQFAERRDLPMRFFTSERLSSVVAHHGLAQEAVVARATGTPSVAEAAALALACPRDKEDAGSGARLLLAKRKSAKVTCALALAPCALSLSHLAGEENGVLTLVGLGPGTANERTMAAAHALRAADCVVGYEGYVDLLERGETRAELCRSAIGSEEERCRYALDSARAGKRTVLLGSGDAGVYGLATLVWQILAEESDDAPPVEVRQVSGVSAMHALAARLGAPLGDDFCAISLSDVMTCETTVVQRIKAAAEGDFVVALYNPQSLTRRVLLSRALALLRERRPPDTPVACGRNISREEESVRIARLCDFDESSVDMHSVVIVGNSKTKCYASCYGTRLYTERGYKLHGGQSKEAG